MTGKPYRLASPHGRLIDRSRFISFTFDGKRLNGHPGDTLASAVMANGQRLFGRSFKYHRPRGVVGLGSEEANALVGVGTGARHEPNLRATQVELYDGLEALSQNRWPSLEFDIGAVNSLFARLLPAGFYYKTFMWPRSFWKQFYEPFIRHAAGLGKAPTGRDPDSYEQIHVHCDVLVVGGGVAGLAAAEAAAASGQRVILADENVTLGGVSDLHGGTIDGKPVADWVAARAASLEADGNVEVLTRTTAVGHFHHNWALLFERLGDDNPATRRAGAPRHRLWKVRASRIVLATGAIERPIPFANNDRPGVMLATAARGFATRYGVSPGATGVIFTNNDDAYTTALELKRAGASIAAIIDCRANPSGALIDEARGAGLRIETGSAVTGLVSARAGKDIQAVKVSAYRSVGGRVLAEEKIGCDWVGVSGGFNPVVHLWRHNGGKIVWDDRIASYKPVEHHDAMVAAGAATGVFDLAACLDSGYAAGDAGDGRAKRTWSRAETPGEAAMEPMWFSPASAPYTAGAKHFIDYQNDVTVADLELAQREGYTSVEHTKRYTTWSMATDQGKTSNIAGLGVLSQATGKSVPEIGVTTFRPPYTPFSFGSIAGLNTRSLFLPVRQTPVYAWHVANGATLEPVGQWRRAYCYPKPGETKAQAIHREVLAVRRKVGVLDASTLGKIEIKGPDAGAFLDRMYTNVFSTLPVGKCRYGLMLNELGFLIDDGVTARLADDRYLMHTTSGGADRIAAWLEEWLQTEWPKLRVFVTPVTEQWAQFAVAGPMARQTIERLSSDIDFSPGSFAFMTHKTGTLAGVPVRVFRISFSGEQSFEIACPAGYGRSLWDALLGAGAEFGIEPYGTEALHILRAEKGFIVIGDETDGTVTPHDVGLSGLVSRKKADFVGKRSLEQSFLKGANRKQLVGLLTVDPNEVLPDGAHAVVEVKDKPPMETIGHVTSTYMSPTLGRSIAMALIRNGRNRMGETLSFPLEGGRVVKATICDPVFYDKEGARQNG